MPRFSTHALSLLVLAAVAAAQQSIVSPDPLFARTEGASFSTKFGAFAAGRYQYSDANLGNSSATIKAFCVRHDQRNYNITEGMGRTWDQVVVSMANSSGTLIPTFSANALSTPTKVFDGPMTWPIQLGAPPDAPAKFEIVIPFSSVWAYAGVSAAMTDLTFHGGRLANSAPWSGGQPQPYVLDSFYVGTIAVGPAVSFGVINGGCVDSNATGVAGASVHMRSESYSLGHPTVALREKMFVEGSGNDFPADSPIMLVLAFGADSTGIPFPGVSCNRIHVDPAGTWRLHPLATNAVGSFSQYQFGLSGGIASYTEEWTGINLAIQGAWNDTQSGQLKFSSASRNTLMALPIPIVPAVGLSTIYDYDPAASVASFSAIADSAAIPIVCYQK